MDVNLVNQLLSDMNSSNFTFIIGSGASRKSGISTGTDLAYNWLGHLINMAGTPPDESFERLKTQIANGRLRELNMAELTSIFGSERIIEILRTDYDSKCTWPMILKVLCFGVQKNYFRIASYLGKHKADLLHSSIIEEMQGKKASSGYFHLAKIMQGGANVYSNRNIVITTNFDDLLQQALYKIFDNGHKTPAIVSHSALAHQIVSMDINAQPVIFKIHNDIYFYPLNTEFEVTYYSEDVKQALKKLITKRMILVVGYSGAKDNLMEYLIHYDEQLTIYWGYYEKPPDSEKFKELSTSHHHVILFKAGDFDRFMEYLATSLLSPTGIGYSKINISDTCMNNTAVNTDRESGLEPENIDNTIIRMQKLSAQEELGLTRFILGGNCDGKIN